MSKEKTGKKEKKIVTQVPLPLSDGTVATGIMVITPEEKKEEPTKKKE